MSAASVTPSRQLPIHRVTLGFQSPERELAYGKAQLERSIGLYRAAMGLSILIHLVFTYLDAEMLGERAPIMWTIRLGMCIPASVIALIASMHPNFYVVNQPLTAFIVFIHGFSMVLGHGLFGAGQTMYFAPGLIMVVMYGFIMLGLRFVWATGVALILVAAQLVLLWQLPTPRGVLVNATETLLISTFILTVGAFRMELLGRAGFYAAEQLVEQERREREAQTERTEWLSVITGFVRHELKNAIAGVSTSLQLVARADLQGAGREYVARASRSLQFMRRFLQHVGDATNLENALRQQDSEPVALSELVIGRVEDLRHQSPECRLQAAVDPGIRVTGNADSLVQMLDKLLNNALEHASAEGPISVSLRSQGSLAMLEVMDVGDPLPKDLDALFRPFVGTKPTSEEGNMGLGLYVARTIVAHHGGTIVAQPLEGMDGARFVVSLPLLRQA